MSSDFSSDIFCHSQDFPVQTIINMKCFSISESHSYDGAEHSSCGKVSNRRQRLLVIIFEALSVLNSLNMIITWDEAHVLITAAFYPGGFSSDCSYNNA